MGSEGVDNWHKDSGMSRGTVGFIVKCLCITMTKDSSASNATTCTKDFP